MTGQRESTRQRALRIPLDYHRARGTLAHWKWMLTLACAAAGGAYLLWMAAGGKPAASQISPGVLAKDHARWDSDCQACHVPFSPQRGDAEGTRALSHSLSFVRGGTKDVHRQTDAKCSECHKSAGPHHAIQIAAEVESCAGCHRDHQGREFAMARMDDAHCTVCHASIAGHRQPTSPPATSPIVNVTTFDRPSTEGSSGHPAFRSLQQQDPGNIRFSHRLHMTLGQLYPGQETPQGKRPVQLACDACHQPETAGSGAYMRPIKYEQHCRGCHPLTMPGQPEAVVPHGLASQQLESVVRGFASTHRDPQRPTPARLIPGRAAQTDAASLQAPPELVFAQKMAELRTNQCSQCHSWQPVQPSEVQSAKIPSTWLRHARFNHDKHRSAAKCVDCHSAAVDKLPAEGIPGRLADDEAVMIPNIDNCTGCHAPRSATVATSGSARFDCAECHRYHQTPVEQKPLRKKEVSPVSFQPADDWLKITLVADRPAEMPKASRSHSFVGTQSCSTTGCHGASGERGSSSAFTRFRADDPHGRAFLLLYSERSRQILRRLRGADEVEPNEKAYFAELERRCIGCHATPAVDPAKVDSPTSYLAGVSCESCHGAAADWEFSHFRRGVQPSGQAKLANHGKAATICAECHIGPKAMGGKTYDVNHDLIAAGHPRLAFEYEAQLANLPAHWSPAKDAKFHFEAWRQGELATAAQQEKLHASRDPLEFASHRCFDCHHGLKPLPATDRVVFPQRTEMPLAWKELLSRPAKSMTEQSAMLRKLLDQVAEHRASAGTRWEGHVQFLLAFSAFTADRPTSGELAKQSESLREMLANSFETLPPKQKTHKDNAFTGGPYDSPSGFDPDDQRLKQILQQIRGSLATP